MLHAFTDERAAALFAGAYEPEAGRAARFETIAEDYEARARAARAAHKPLSARLWENAARDLRQEAARLRASFGA